MNDEAAIAAAGRLAAAWGGLVGAPRLIRNRENIVFEVHLQDGGHAALRLHRSGYQTAAAIRSELVWTKRLADAGFPCPRPLPTLGGDLVAMREGDPVASAVCWIDAGPIGENNVAFAGDATGHCALYRDVGRLIRHLHDTTDSIETADIQRPLWDSEGLLGDNPLWGRFWENPSLSAPEATELLEARAHAAQHLAQLGDGEGLIHADLLQENILQNQYGIWLIDFDDSGFGYRGYDLGTALIQHAELPYLDALSDALCEGYGANAALRKAVPLFIMLRSMASCGWIMSRADTDDARQRFYAERALTCARRYAQTTTSSSA